MCFDEGSWLARALPRNMEDRTRRLLWLGIWIRRVTTLPHRWPNLSEKSGVSFHEIWRTQNDGSTMQALRSSSNRSRLLFFSLAHPAGTGFRRDGQRSCLERTSVHSMLLYAHNHSGGHRSVHWGKVYRSASMGFHGPNIPWNRSESLGSAWSDLHILIFLI